jgi:ATP-dependent DNA ligase
VPDLAPLRARFAPIAARLPVAIGSTSVAARSALRAKADNFVLDGELMVPRGDSLSFGALQDRVHPSLIPSFSLGHEGLGWP